MRFWLERNKEYNSNKLTTHQLIFFTITADRARNMGHPVSLSLYDGCKAKNVLGLAEGSAGVPQDNKLLENITIVLLKIDWDS